MKKFLTVAFALLAVTTLLSAAPKGKKNGPKIQKKDPLTVFDPNTLDVAPDKTQLVERDGKKYLKVECDGYSNAIIPAEVELKGYNRFVFELYSEEGTNEAYQFVVAIEDKDQADISILRIASLPTEPTIGKVGHEIAQSWGNKLSKTDKSSYIQCYCQDTAKGYSVVKGTKVPLYIGKIYAE